MVSPMCNVDLASAKSNRMLQRCWGWDYKAPCIYMITMTLANRLSMALGRLVVDNDGNGEASKIKAHIELTAAGRAVEAQWRRMGEITPQIKPLDIVIMPDHIHGILRVTERLKRPLGQILAGFKTGSSKAATGQGGLWSEGFQDSILFREGQLHSMFNYLRDNPRRLAVKRYYREFFRVKREVAFEVTSKFALTSEEQNGRAALTSEKENGEVARTGEKENLLYFQAIGNESLLKAPTIFQVQCSRKILSYRRESKSGGGFKIARDEKGAPIIESETSEFSQKLEIILAMAKKGAVLVSSCISDGEREIARRAMEMGLKLITLSNKGFSDLFKPSGKAFDSVSEGRLLMLAPIAWEYTPGEKKMTRIDACTLNRIAQLIAGDGASEINYRGVEVQNVDALVKRACLGVSR